MFNFEFSRIRLEFKALNSFKTPYFLGSTFRGIMGRKLKKMVCIKPFEPSCESCEFKTTCPYTTIFETEAMLNQPSKYIMKPPFKIQELKENETINLDITLLGDSANYWEFIINSYSEVLNIGKERYLKLQNIYFYHPFEEKYYPIKSFIPKFEAKKFLELKTDKEELNLKFNPTSLKNKSQMVRFDEFNKDILIKSILSRVSVIAQNYGERTDRLFIDKEKIDVEYQNFKPSPMKRWSNRKKKHMTIPAFEGEMGLKGEINEIYPYLKLIENINLGKSVSFGLGSVEIVD